MSVIIDFVLDDIEFGGPSPLFAAFILSTGCLINGASKLYCLYLKTSWKCYFIFVIGHFYAICFILFIGHTHTMGAFHIHPRIILISDGRPTDITTFLTDDNPSMESDEVCTMNV